MTNDEEQMTSDAQTPAELFSQVPQSLQSIVENFWDDWCKSCAEKEKNPNLNLPLSMLGKTWICSDFVARNCIRYPGIFYNLLAEGV